MKRVILLSATLALASNVFAQATQTLQVTLKDNQIITSQSSVKAGKVDMVVTNAGSLKHELVVMKTDAPADQLPMNSKGTRTQEGAADVGEVENLAGGKTESKTFDLQPGNYVLICNLPGHYMMGMRTPLKVN